MTKPASVIPPAKERELRQWEERFQRERLSGTLTQRVRFHNGQPVTIAIVPDFEEDIRPSKVMAPVCFADDKPAA